MSTSKTKKSVSSLELKDSTNSSSKIIHDETLTKADLAEVLFDQIGINKREAKELVDVFFEEIRNTLIDGQPVKLSGFGNFLLRDKSSRPGRNPRTGEVVDIAPRRVVTFHPSAKLKSRIADKMLEQFE